MLRKKINFRNVRAIEEGRTGRPKLREYFAFKP